MVRHPGSVQNHLLLVMDSEFFTVDHKFLLFDFHIVINCTLDLLAIQKIDQVLSLLVVDVLAIKFSD